jgi:hypothetical protein
MVRNSFLVDIELVLIGIVLNGVVKRVQNFNYFCLAVIVKKGHVLCNLRVLMLLYCKKVHNLKNIKFKSIKIF